MRSHNGSFGLLIGGGRGWGIFLPYYQAGVDNWPQNRLSRVGVGISPGLLFPSHPFFFQGKAEVRHISEQMTRRTFTLTCGTWLYTRHSSLLKAFQLLSSELRPGPLIFQGFMCHKQLMMAVVQQIVLVFKAEDSNNK